jgi:hypothetical protein
MNHTRPYYLFKLDAYQIGVLLMATSLAAWVGIAFLLFMCLFNELTFSPFSEAEYPLQQARVMKKKR